MGWRPKEAARMIEATSARSRNHMRRSRHLLDPSMAAWS